MADKVQMASADLNEDDVKAVTDVVRSGRLALGPMTEKFEKSMARYIGVKHAIALNSGTAALHLIVKALGIGPGDEVIVPSFTFAASVNAILFERGVPVFVDIESDTYNLDPQDIERKITSKTKAIMAVDVFGHPVDWAALTAIARRHKLAIIDDSCEALGAEFKGTKIGRFGDAAAFAFYPNKQMTTGEGGIIVTDSDQIAKIARSLRNQGRDEMGHWLQHERLGYNYRMDEMSAALGVTQLARLEDFLKKRQKVAELYGKRLKGLDWVSAPQVRPEVRMSWFVYVVTLAKDMGLDRDSVAKALAEQGIPSRAYFSPIHRQPYIDAKLKLPVTDSISERTLALPFHNHLTEAEVDTVVSALEQVAKRSRKKAA